MDIPRRTKQRPTFPSNRNNLGRARALSRRSSRCCNASLELVYVAGVLREGGWPPPPRPVGAVTADVAPHLQISLQRLLRRVLSVNSACS